MKKRKKMSKWSKNWDKKGVKLRLKGGREICSLDQIRTTIWKPPLTNGERAEYCFKSTVSEKRTHWVLRQTRWVLRETRWVRVCTQIVGRKELTEFGPRNSVRPKKLTELSVWNRTLRNRIRPVSEQTLGDCRKVLTPPFVAPPFGSCRSYNMALLSFFWWLEPPRVVMISGPPGCSFKKSSGLGSGGVRLHKGKKGG